MFQLPESSAFPANPCGETGRSDVPGALPLSEPKRCGQVSPGRRGSELRMARRISRRAKVGRAIRRAEVGGLRTFVFHRNLAALTETADERRRVGPVAGSGTAIGCTPASDQCGDGPLWREGWLERVRVGTSMTVLMYLLPPISGQLQDRASAARNQPQGGADGDHAANAQGRCARSRPVRAADQYPAFEDRPFVRRRAAGHPADNSASVPKKVTPAYLATCPLILGNEASALGAGVSWNGSRSRARRPGAR